VAPPSLRIRSCSSDGNAIVPGPQAVYLFMSVCGLVHTLLLAALFEETLPRAQRSEAPPRFQSPMGMMKVSSPTDTTRLSSCSNSLGLYGD
jgi:hypothetical protein